MISSRAHTRPRVSPATAGTAPSRPARALPMGATGPLVAQAQALVAAFYQRFHGLTEVTASPKELAHARQLLGEHGAEHAYVLLAYAQEAASDTHYHPQTFMGILHYLPAALAAAAARAAQAAQARRHQAAMAARRCHERYLLWRHQQLAQLRASMPRAALRHWKTPSGPACLRRGPRPLRCRWPSGWRSTMCWRPRPSCPRSRRGGNTTRKGKDHAHPQRSGPSLRAGHGGENGPRRCAGQTHGRAGATHSGPVDDAPATCHSTRMGSGGAGDVGRTRLSRPHDHARGTMSRVSAHGTADHTAERKEDGQG